MEIHILKIKVRSKSSIHFSDFFFHYFFYDGDNSIDNVSAGLEVRIMIILLYVISCISKTSAT